MPTSWLQVAWMAAGPELDDGLRASVYTWLTKVLLPAKFPGIDVEEVRSFEEVGTMLAERAMEWTREWKEEGRQMGRRESWQESWIEGSKEGWQEGWREGLQEGRREVGQAIKDLLLSEMTERFGVVPEQVRQQVEGIQDFEGLRSLGRRLRVASSLDDLQN